MIKLKFKEWDCILKKDKYANNNNLAILLLEDNDYRDIIAVATVNTDEVLPENFAYIKTYSENKGILETLVNSGVIKKIHGEKQQGYVKLPLVEFDLDKI